MLVAKIIICILAFSAFFVTRRIYENNYYKLTRSSKVVAGIAGVLSITFCILLITTNWNLFTIPKMLLFISVCLYILFKDEYDDSCAPFWIGLVVTFITFIVTGIMYLNNIEACEVPDVSTKRSTIICAKDNSSITGSTSGSILSVHGAISEESVYKYYYQLEDGGIKQGTIPAASTTIYFVASGEEAYLETVITTKYCMNNNNSPATRCLETSEITYKLYVPEDSVTNVYVFDAE